MKTVIIVQARISSTRLPGKVMMLLGGVTILEHVLRRCQLIQGVDQVCCAIPEANENDIVAEEAERVGATVFRGSENDVLDRYWQAAKMCKADEIVRVTSDCPLIDPKICDEVIALRQSEKADYASLNSPPSWPHGLDCEVITFEWLDRSAREATKLFEREHVTQYARNHLEVRQVNLMCPLEGLKGNRWTVDTQDDFNFFTALWRHLPTDKLELGYLDILETLEKNPELALINLGQDRFDGLNKSIRES